MPKQPAPTLDTVTLKELRGEIDNALAFSKKQDAQEQFNSQRSAFSQIAPTQQHHVGRGGPGDAWSLRNHGAQLAVQLLGGTDKPPDKHRFPRLLWRRQQGCSGGGITHTADTIRSYP